MHASMSLLVLILLVPLCTGQEEDGTNTIELGDPIMLSHSVEEEAGYEFIGGIILIALSFPLLWLNEFRAANLYRLIHVGKKVVVYNAPNEMVDHSLNGKLIHTQGTTQTTPHFLRDEELGIMTPSCIKYKRTTYMYQNVEHHRVERRGERNVTVYHYTQEWLPYPIESSDFVDQDYFNPRRPWPCESVSITASMVHLGEFNLTASQINRIDWFTERRVMEHELQMLNPVMISKTGFPFMLDNGTIFQRGEYGMSVGSTISHPQVGDIRIMCEYIPNGVISVLGRQVEYGFREWAPPCCADGSPYRTEAHHTYNSNHSSIYEEGGSALLISPVASVDDAHRRRHTAEEGERRRTCGCCYALCCCYAFIFPNDGKEMLLATVKGTKSARAIFDDRSQDKRHHINTNLIRVIGWLMMFLGMYCVYSPLIHELEQIPILGEFLDRLSKATIWAVCVGSSCVWMLVLVSTAWLIARPLYVTLSMAFGMAFFLGIST